MHHETTMSEEVAERFADLFKAVGHDQTGPGGVPGLGATGRFPGGKLTPNDEGEIMFAVGVLKRKVVINFGKSVASIGMSSRQARQLAESLLMRANQIDARPYRNRRRRRGKRPKT